MTPQCAFKWYLILNLQHIQNSVLRLFSCLHGLRYVWVKFFNHKMPTKIFLIFFILIFMKSLTKIFFFYAYLILIEWKKKRLVREPKKEECEKLPKITCTKTKINIVCKKNEKRKKKINEINKYQITILCDERLELLKTIPFHGIRFISV